MDRWKRIIFMMTTCMSSDDELEERSRQNDLMKVMLDIRFRCCFIRL